MMRAAVPVLALIVAAACGAREPAAEGPAPASPVVLCVRNEAPAHGNVTARAGLVRFDVLPEQMRCKRVTVTGSSLQLTASAPGGGLLEPLQAYNSLVPSGSTCWRWRITGSPGGGLTPCGDAEAVVADTVS